MRSSPSISSTSRRSRRSSTSSLKGLYKRVADLGYNITLSDKAKEFVATKGYDVRFGARPLKRAIQTYIEDGLSEIILSEEAKPGDTIAIDKDDDKQELSFSVTKAALEEKPAEEKTEKAVEEKTNE